MGRTFEVLTRGRARKLAGVEPVAAIPFPSADLEPPATVSLVPAAADDLPNDDNALPYIEVGGPRPSVPASPQLLAPKPLPPSPVGDLTFQLLPAAEAAPVVADHLGSDLVAYHQPAHPAGRQYRRLTDGIAAQLPADRCPVLLFSPLSGKAGGTTTVLNLAITRAGDGNGRVLVVEVERSEKSAATRLGGAAVPGLRELLARTIPMSIAIHRTGVEGLYVLPAGKADLGADEAARLPSLLDQFRARFDWVLVDAPPWGTYPLNLWAKSSDGVFLVMRQEEWDAPQADFAHEAIALAGGRLRGCITIRD